MRSESPIVHQVLHVYVVAKGREVGDESAMTTPPQCLAAHDGGSVVRGVTQYRVDRGEEIWLAHVARITPEGGISPNYVR